jgi:predicted phage tail protein
MKIKLHGIFAKDYPGEFEMKVKTVAEAIEGWSRQVGFYEDRMAADRPVARIVGFDTVESLEQETDVKEIHLIPAMLGGGGKWGTILVGAALIGLAFVPGGQVGSFLIGSALHTAVLSAGIGMVLTGAMGLFIKAPSVSKSSDPEASKYLGLSNNTTAIGTPIAICYGEVPVNGQVLALNVDSTDMISGAFPATPT